MGCSNFATEPHLSTSEDRAAFFSDSTDLEEPNEVPLPRVQENRPRAFQNRQTASASGDLTLGLDMTEVVSLWGRPVEVKTAGDPGNGNELWIYREGLTSPWSMNSARRVFFEKGRVVGWNSQ